MDKDASWYGSRPRPEPHCVRRGPSSPTKEAQQPPSFRPMSILWPRSPISATAELLSHCSRHSVSLLYNGPPFPLKIVPYHRGLDLPLRNFTLRSVPKTSHTLHQRSPPRLHQAVVVYIFCAAVVYSAAISFARTGREVLGTLRKEDVCRRNRK